jgi:[ribosomal protein S5]-alanine N-acetyltransferase
MSTALETSRLVMRRPTEDDVFTIAGLARRREIADTTVSIPHPYTEQHALEWVRANQGDLAIIKRVVFVVTVKSTEEIIGSVGLREIDPEHNQAELGLWIGVENWGHGYATEAVPALLRYAFEELDLNRVYAHHMIRNPASGRVLGKAGFKREGVLRQHVRKWGVYEDVMLLAILREDWVKHQPSSP